MTETANIVCPNCGANITNRSNCEYCGSLLVRFVDKGIDLSQTTYLNDDATFPGLADALRKNLKLQKERNNYMVTNIYCDIPTSSLSGIQCIAGVTARSTGGCYSTWHDGSPIFSESESGPGLVVRFGFRGKYSGLLPMLYDTGDDKDDIDRNNRFKNLDSFPLFLKNKCDISYYHLANAPGYEYAIDFGEDADGAARLLSEVFRKVYLIEDNHPIEFHTVEAEDDDEDRKNTINAEVRTQAKPKFAAYVLIYGGIYLLLKMLFW